MTAQDTAQDAAPEALSSAGLPDDLHLGEPVTDATHAEFVLLLDAVAKADDAGFLAALDEWMDHTRHHFAQEEAWMDAMQFGPRHCHAGEHKQVLAVCEAVRKKVVEEGRLALGRQLAGELSGWFAHHVHTMDSMMVNHMRENGFTLVEAPATVA